MPAFPNTPGIQRDAIVAVTIVDPPKVVVFQYNPDILIRTLNASIVGNEDDMNKIMRLNQSLEKLNEQ